MQNTTSVRPTKPQKPYIDAVIQALYEEQLAVYNSNGQHLDEHRFKTCPIVFNMVEKFYKTLNVYWKRHASPVRLVEAHQDFFGKVFDFSTVDLESMVTEEPQPQAISDHTVCQTGTPTILEIEIKTESDELSDSSNLTACAQCFQVFEDNVQYNKHFNVDHEKPSDNLTVHQ